LPRFIAARAVAAHYQRRVEEPRSQDLEEAVDFVGARSIGVFLDLREDIKRQTQRGAPPQQFMMPPMAAFCRART
jgi:hypothetical protein